MRTIAFIVVYMGKLPNYFPVWLESCKNNPTVDFILFTDDNSEYPYPANVHVNGMQFDELKDLIQGNYDFPIELPAAYKLCDFRPAYGEIFRNFLKGYDFWGHCDIDLIWGDIRHYVTDELLDRFLRIYPHGHCSLYKNTFQVNRMYRTLRADGFKTYQEVFSLKTNMLFDEWPGMSSIMKLNKIPFYYNKHYADLDSSTAYLKVNGRQDLNSRRSYFVYEDKKVYWTNGERKEEFLYVHFQKRKIKLEKTNADYSKLYLLPPGIIKEGKKVENMFGGGQIDFNDLCGRYLYPEYIKFYINMIERRKNNLIRKIKNDYSWGGN